MVDARQHQLVLAKLEQETQLRLTAEAGKAQAEQDRERWKAIADGEAARADKLAEANADRREESAGLRASIGYLRQSVDEYKVQREADQREIRSLKSSRKWYVAGGFLLGGGSGIAACRAAR